LGKVSRIKNECHVVVVLSATNKKEKLDVLTCSEHQQLTLPPPLFIPA
jgi:hypothetical protein